MDFALLIPMIALSIPVVAIVVAGFNKRAQLQLEETKLRLGEGGGVHPEDLDELRSELDQMRAELGDVHERLDFTERLLAQTRDREQLPPA
jgi:hypothetical protein